MADGHAVGREPLGVDDDLVLLLEAADGGDLGDALDGLELGLEVEVLRAPKLGQVVGPRRVAERVGVDPADAGRVRPERGRDAVGQAVADLAEVLQHAAARPVQVGAVLEDDVDEARPEHRVAADRPRAGHGQEGRGQRVRHLLLDDLRPLAGVVGADDDLDVAEIRDGVDGCRDRGPGAQARHHQRHQSDQQPVVGAPLDESFEDAVLCVGVSHRYGVLSVSSMSMPGIDCMAPSEAARRASESIKNWALVTTRSPTATPERMRTTPSPSSPSVTG